MTEQNHSNETLVIRKDNQGITNLQINRPKAYNALSLECMESLIELLNQIDQDDSVRVVILSGSGKGFCAGHDLKEMRANPTDKFYDKTFNTCSELMQTITKLTKPVIAKVHGIATAAGCQLVATCDLAIAVDDARFGTPGVNIGLFCSTPMVALSRSVSRKHAMEMLLLGDLISASKAVEIGLINHAVPLDMLEKTTQAMAEKIASKSPLTLKTGKEAFYKQIHMNQSEAYQHCSQVMIDSMQTKDVKEGIDAFITKRKPIWCGE